VTLSATSDVGPGTPEAADREAPARPRVLVACRLHPAGLDLLRRRAEVAEVVPEEVTPATLAGSAGLIVRGRPRVTADLLRATPGLRVVARVGSGVDTIDVAAATELGVWVTNAPGATAVAVAEHTIGLLLALARHLPAAHAGVAAGRWEKSALEGRELCGRTLGVVGLGRIGREVARRARALGMRVLAFDPLLPWWRTAAARCGGIRRRRLAGLLSQSQCLTVHVPLTPATRGLIGPDELALLPPGALVVNCARGGVIDEAALRSAVASGRLGGAALDVFEREPPPDGDLLRTPGFIFSPHIAGSTVEGQRRAAETCARDVLAVLTGRPPRWAVNRPWAVLEAECM